MDLRGKNGTTFVLAWRWEKIGDPLKLKNIWEMEPYYMTGEHGVTGLGSQTGMADIFVCLNPSNKMSQAVGLKKIK